jgi:hypothetical protein
LKYLKSIVNDTKRFVISVCLIGVLCTVTAFVWPIIDHLLDSADLAPSGLKDIQKFSSTIQTQPSNQQSVRSQHMVIVVIDGMRVDEAQAMSSVKFLKTQGIWTTVQLSLPSLSRPFYHTLLTGVPSWASGVRTNRFTEQARVPSLADVVREAGGQCAWFTQGLTWFPHMYSKSGDIVDTKGESYQTSMDTWLRRKRQAKPSLTLIHFIESDSSAHASGIYSNRHQRAMMEANLLIDRVQKLTEQDILLVLADHGHIAGGGHGGNENEVRSIPFLLRVPGESVQTISAGNWSQQIAPTLAKYAGISEPGWNLGVPMAELFPHTRGVENAQRRSEMAIQTADMQRQELRRLRGLWMGLWAVVWIGAGVCLYRKTSLSLRWLFLYPMVFTGLLWVIHVGLWARPWSVSGIDEVNRHACRLLALGSALSCATLLGLRALFGAQRGQLPSMDAWLLVAWTSFGFGSFSLALVAGSLGRWPLSAYEFYAPILHLTVMGGVNISLICLVIIDQMLPKTPPAVGQP